MTNGGSFQTDDIVLERSLAGRTRGFISWSLQILTCVCKLLCIATSNVQTVRTSTCWCWTTTLHTLFFLLLLQQCLIFICIGRSCPSVPDSANHFSLFSFLHRRTAYPHKFQAPFQGKTVNSRSDPFFFNMLVLFFKDNKRLS